jgi:hypothetical protein
VNQSPPLLILGWIAAGVMTVVALLALVAVGLVSALFGRKQWLYGLLLDDARPNRRAD